MVRWGRLLRPLFTGNDSFKNPAKMWSPGSVEDPGGGNETQVLWKSSPVLNWSHLSSQIMNFWQRELKACEGAGHGGTRRPPHAPTTTTLRRLRTEDHTFGLILGYLAKTLSQKRTNTLKEPPFYISLRTSTICGNNSKHQRFQEFERCDCSPQGWLCGLRFQKQTRVSGDSGNRVSVEHGERDSML